MSEQLGDQDRQQNIDERPKHTESLLDWIMGLLFAVTDVASLFIKPTVALLMLLLAAIILPPGSRYMESKLPIRLSTPIKLLIIAVVMYIFTKIQ